MARLLDGTLDLPGYVALLRALHEIYLGLERGLDLHQRHPAVTPVRWPLLYRTGALRQDLRFLAGPDWEEELPPTPAAVRYGAHLARLARGHRPWLLGAHAYVRYLGDLHGGRILAGKVASLVGGGKGAGGTAFHHFPPEVEAAPARWRSTIREGLEALPLTPDQAEGVVAEARSAFRRHVAIFREL